MRRDKGVVAQAVAQLLHRRGDKLRRGEPVAEPVVPASTFHLPGSPEALFQYARIDQPNLVAVEEALALLEGAPCVAFPSGMAAIAAVLHATLRAEDRVLIPSDCYYNARVLTERFLAPFGVAMTTRSTPSYLEGGFEGYRLVWVETPSNPGLEVCDLAAVAAAAREAGALVVADNTTATALGQRPLELGAHILVAADTKAPGGHSDLLFGHVATEDANLLERVREWRKLAGAVPGPFEAWQLLRSLATLEVRLERMCANAAAIAERLADHPEVVAVRYPGLPGDPSFEIAGRQMLQPGFMIGLTLSDNAAADRFIGGCRFVQPATSFGGTHTSAERRDRWGDAVAPGYVRLSVGIEPLEPLWAEMDGSLRER